MKNCQISKQIHIKYLYDNKYFFVLMILLMSTLLCVPLIFSGIPYGHDLMFHLSRISALSSSFNYGNFMPKIYPNYLYGYGYANGLFYPDLFLYLPSIFVNLGFNLIVIYKVFIFIITLSTALTMYYCMNQICRNRLLSFCSAILYDFSAYRATDVFIRQALGEVLAMIFLPIVVLGIYEIMVRNYQKWYILSLGMAGIVLSHILTTMITIVFLIFLCICYIPKLLKEKSRIVYLFFSAVVTILLTSYFILPIIEQMMSYNFNFNKSIDMPSNRTANILNLIFIKPIIDNGQTWAPGGIGVIFGLLILLSIFLLIKISNKKSDVYYFCLVIFLLANFSLIASTNLFPWKIIDDTLGIIQFPWRLYQFSTLFLSISSILILKLFYKKIKFIMMIIILIGSLGAYINNVYIAYDNKMIYGHNSYSIAGAEYLPLKVNLKYIKCSNHQKINFKNNIKIVDFKREKQGTTITVKFKDNYNYSNVLEFPLIYYQGYKAVQKSYLNNKWTEVSVKQSDNGLVSVVLNNENNGEIRVWYCGTNIQKFSSFITILSWFMFFIYVINYRRIKKII